MTHTPGSIFNALPPKEQQRIRRGLTRCRRFILADMATRDPELARIYGWQPERD